MRNIRIQIGAKLGWILVQASCVRGISYTISLGPLMSAFLNFAAVYGNEKIHSIVRIKQAVVIKVLQPAIKNILRKVTVFETEASHSMYH